MKKILVTSALPYANGPIHFGHIAGAYLPADVYARFERLKKNDVLYICGSDEYGVAISMSAELANRTPKEHVDIFHKINKDLFSKLNISFDHYSRTTWEGHIKVVQEFFLDLYNNGYIEEKTEAHLYSEEEKKFLADRYVVGTCPKCKFENARGDECPKCAASFEARDLLNPRSKNTNLPLILKPSKHWYLRFDKFKDKLTQWISKKNFKSSVLNFAMDYINNLKPRSITRDSTWGVPVPLKEAEGKVLYVWFDAPIGYISATMQWAIESGDKDKWKSYWLDEKTHLVNFIGKDNIPFHAVFFPAMEMGQNTAYKIVDDIPANDFLMLEKRQFSKSDNWYIDLETFFKKFTADQIRFHLALIAPENHDSDFTWKGFQNSCNTELVGKLGNFVHRTLTFTQSYLDGKIFEANDLDYEDKSFLNKMDVLIEEAQECYSSYKLKRAAEIVLELATLGNVYFDSKKPWALRKDESKKTELKKVLNLCIRCVKAIALISSPIIPSSSQKIWEMIGFDTDISKMDFDKEKKLDILVGKALMEPKIIFQKIEDETVQEEINKLVGKTEGKKVMPNDIQPMKEEISFSDFEKIDLRVAKIIEAGRVEKSDKLLKIIVDLGFEKRQIISGIAKSISPDSLIGKKVIVLCNLKPAMIMKLESQGMIIAAGEDDKNLELPSVENIPIGHRVF